MIAFISSACIDVRGNVTPATRIPVPDATGKASTRLRGSAGVPVTAPTAASLACRIRYLRQPLAPGR